MFKKINKKKTKLIITAVLALIVVIGGTGIALYAQDQQQKETLRQEVFTAYWSLTIPQKDKYNDEELQEYNNILEQREQSFLANDTAVLLTIQNTLNELDRKVKQRLQREEAERKTKEEQEAKEKAEAERKAQEQSNNWVDDTGSSHSGNSNRSGGSSHRGNGNSSNRGSGSNELPNKPWDSGCDDLSCWNVGDWEWS